MERSPPIGHLLRDWRQRRRRSQLDLAGDACISTRHLSFVETGRSRPSRELLLHLTDLLDLPLRERNRLLLAAGFAPQFPERPLDAPELRGAREAVQRVLEAHEPYPAVAIDRHWNLVLANAAARRWLAGLPAHLLAPAPNVLRISLHPQGLASSIINLGEWRQHLLHRLRRQVEAGGDAELASLLLELAAHSPLPGEQPAAAPDTPGSDIAVLFRLRSPLGELALLSTLTTFGTPTDVTLSELALEAFYPAEPVTAERLRQLAQLPQPEAAG